MREGREEGKVEAKGKDNLQKRHSSVSMTSSLILRCPRSFAVPSLPRGGKQRDRERPRTSENQKVTVLSQLAI